MELSTVAREPGDDQGLGADGSSPWTVLGKVHVCAPSQGAWNALRDYPVLLPWEQDTEAGGKILARAMSTAVAAPGQDPVF